MTRRSSAPAELELELEELALPFPVSLDLRTIAPAHAVAMATDLEGMALPARSRVRCSTRTLAEFHIGHRLELAIATPAGPARASLERTQLSEDHPVRWELSYRRRAGSSDTENVKGDNGPELLALLLERAEAIAVAQTPPPEPPRRRRKATA